MHNMTIAQKIKQIRELKGYTQEHLASKLGITQSNYSKMESGGDDIVYSKIVDIAKALDITPEQLLAFDGAKYLNSFNNVKGNINVPVPSWSFLNPFFFYLTVLINILFISICFRCIILSANLLTCLLSFIVDYVKLIFIPSQAVIFSDSSQPPTNIELSRDCVRV